MKSSYFWVLAVPIAAKLMPQLEVLLSSAEARISLSLPFSWQMFYFGSVLFAISSWIYAVKCPYLIRQYRSPNEYWDSGRALRELNLYAESTLKEMDKCEEGEKIEGYRKTHSKKAGGVVLDSKQDLNSKFFFLQEITQYKRPIWRATCTLGYVIGGAFFSIVLVQNFIYVLDEARGM